MKNIKKKRDIYAVSFIKLVDSAWTPRVDMKRIEGAYRGRKDYINVTTSVDRLGLDAQYEPVCIKKFKGKEEFISFMVQESVKIWDQYEARKQFNKECVDILDDIDSGVEPKPSDTESDLDEFYSDHHDNVKNYYRTKTGATDLTQEEIEEKIADIKKRDIGSSWKPYLLFKEVFGVDLINTPDFATDERVEELKASRPSATDNGGIVRRAKGRGE